MFASSGLTHCRPAASLPPLCVRLPVLQHAGVQPFLDEPHDAPVRNPVLDELHQPFVRQMASKKLRMSASSTQFTCPRHAVPTVERIQRTDADCAPGGIRTRSRESRFRRWRSAPRPWPVGQSCPPVPVTPSGRCRPSALGMYTRRTGLRSIRSALQPCAKGPGGLLPDPRHSAATFPRPRPAPLPA